MRKAHLVLAATLALASGLEAQDTYRLSGDRVAIYNLAGEIELVAGSGSDVVVRMTRGGDDAQSLEVRTDQIAGRNTLRVIYPSDRVVYSAHEGRWSSTVRVADDGTFGDRGSRVRISSSGSGLEAWANLRVEVPAGRDVAIHVAAGGVDASGVAADLNLDLGTGPVVANGIDGDLIVDTGSGSVEVGDVAGELEIDTGSGSVTVEGASGPRVSIDTGSGGVRGADITTDHLLVDTGSGRIVLQRLSAADVEIDTGSGGIEADFSGELDRLVVDTGSGSITLGLPASLDADLELDTGSGSIDVDFQMDVFSMERDHLEARIGSGRGQIKVDTGSGSIRLRRN